MNTAFITLFMGLSVLSLILITTFESFVTSGCFKSTSSIVDLIMLKCKRGIYMISVALMPDLQ